MPSPGMTRVPSRWPLADTSPPFVAEIRHESRSDGRIGMENARKQANRGHQARTRARERPSKGDSCGRRSSWGGGRGEERHGSSRHRLLPTKALPDLSGLDPLHALNRVRAGAPGASRSLLRGVVASRAVARSARMIDTALKEPERRRSPHRSSATRSLRSRSEVRVRRRAARRMH